jgi:malonyl CoA-acyl carrier protein transacylase
VTFRLQPGDRLQLVLHRGAAVRDDAADFRFEDASGLLEWVAADRAVITFRDLDDVAAKQSAVVDVVNRWVAAQLVTSRRAKCRKASAVKIAEYTSDWITPR